MKSLFQWFGAIGLAVLGQQKQVVFKPYNVEFGMPKYHNPPPMPIENKLIYCKCEYCKTSNQTTSNCKNCGAPIESYIENES